MRPATDTIHAPPFPRGLPWVNTEQLRIDKQLGRPLVVAFWDSRRAVSIRPLLELQRWHEAYSPRGARIIAVHVDGEDVGTTHEDVARAATRFGLTMPIVVDQDLLIADAYGLQGVPSRYTFDQGLKLVDAHFGLGGYADGEQLLLALVEHGERVLAGRGATPGAAAEPPPAEPATEPEEDESCDQGAAVPPAKQPRLIVTPPATDELPEPIAEVSTYVAPEPGEVVDGDYRGPYAAGAVWLQLRGAGTATLASHAVTADGGGTYLLVDHGLDHEGQLAELTLTDGLVCDGIQLEPGIAPAGA